MIHAIDASYSEWECTDTSSACHRYLLPTPIPTREPTFAPTPIPTTAIPTESPTKYAPFMSHHTVYVRKHDSCDYGLCRKEIGNHHLYCNDTLDWNLSISDETPCLSMLYALNCLKGTGGYPTNKTVCNDHYDGYGLVDVGRGWFDLASAVDIVYKQQMIKGVNETVTRLYHNDGYIQCEWKCYFKLSDITYTSRKNESHKVEVFNKGHAYFENVLFHANASGFRLEFDLSQHAYVDFTYCTFTDTNILFNIRDAVRVVFDECVFDGNQLQFKIESNALVTFQHTEFVDNYAINASSISMIDIQSSAVSVTECVFEGNHNFYSLLENTNGINDQIEITSSRFESNMNINHIFYALNSVTASSNITSIRNCIMYRNGCSNDGCIHVLNGHLNIDEFSVTEWATTVSPTVDPTPLPTQAPITTIDTLYCGYRLSQWAAPYDTLYYQFLIIDPDPLKSGFTVSFDYCSTTVAVTTYLYDENWKSITDYTPKLPTNRDNCNTNPVDLEIVLHEGVYFIGVGSATAEQGVLHMFIDCASLSPQPSPTFEPTSIPSALTVPPTIRPTMEPTFSIVSFTPTQEPTMEPTENPTYTATTTLDLSTFALSSSITYSHGHHPFDLGVYLTPCGSQPCYRIKTVQLHKVDTWIQTTIDLNGKSGVTLSYTGYTFDCTFDSAWIKWQCDGAITTTSTSTSSLWKYYEGSIDIPDNINCSLLHFQIGAPAKCYNYVASVSISYDADPSELTSSPSNYPTLPSPTTSSNNPTTDYPTMTTIPPTQSPTLNVTDKLLHFGRTVNYTNPIELYLYDFEPTSLRRKIHFIHFEYESNDTIQFEPCLPFETYTFHNIIFNALASFFVPNYAFASSGAFLRDSLLCHDTAVCFIQCINATLSCFGSTFDLANTSSATLVNCNTESSCEDNTIAISSSNVISAVKCDANFACKGATIYVDRSNDFILECVSSESCINLQINITESTNASITCFGVNACRSMRVFSTSNDIHIFMYNFNQDVIVTLPSQYDPQNVHCNPNEAYLLLDGYPSYKSLNDSAKRLFGGDMPCSGLIFSFYDSNKPDCDIRYTFDTYTDRMRDFDPQYMSCYHPDTPIMIHSIVAFDCVGTDDPTTDPTTDPTSDPTIDPSADPTSDPTDNPTNDPTFDPTMNPTFRPTFDPTADPTFDPTADPTKNPTNNPTSNPTSVPTIDPTNDPTIDPTIDPTVDPTIDPTIDPTNDPTIDPTQQPTNDPSIDPTTDPTVNPSREPTADPSQNPSINPTKRPTKSPTRKPTARDAYDSYFDVIYILKHLSEANIVEMIENADFFDIMIMHIEAAYVDDPDTLLQFDDFWLIVYSLHDIKIHKIKHNPSRYKFDLMESKDLLRINAAIRCKETACK
eukprot:1007155_1